MKIVVLDGYTENPGDLSWDGIRQFGELTTYDFTDQTDMRLTIERIGDAEAILVNDVVITEEVMDACKSLRLIAVIATGYDNVDVEAAARHGIAVYNVPAYGTMPVAQHAMALLLEICNNTAAHCAEVRAGNWAQCAQYQGWERPMIELDGKTLGIIGFGRIGQAFARMASAMGMRVLAYSRTVREDAKQIAQYVDMNTLLAESDVISLHCPATPQTLEIIDREAVEKMKDGVILLNVSRGRLLCEQAVARALASGKIMACGLDVLSEEPPENGRSDSLFPT